MKTNLSFRALFLLGTTLTATAAFFLAGELKARAAAITFDDFNVNNGHFTSNPSTGSGSSANIASTSTAIRITTNAPLEGTGQQKLTLNATTAGTAMRLRHLSGGGTPANNISFTTSPGDDGWIGLYLKADATNDPNWTVQIWIEGTAAGNNNGSVPKTVIADGTWHLYEWNLDDNSGGPDGWGTISGIIAGSATVGDISHTIDSVVFRNASGPASSTLYMDFVAKSATGSISNLLTAPCLSTSGVLVSGPVSTDTNQVTVSGVAANATAVTVYQNTGTAGAFVSIGAKTSGVVAGNNSVTVSGLVKNAIVAATQTVSGQESCVPTTGIFVGSGANQPIRSALSIRETSSTGPAGTAGDTSSANIHFLGATSLSSGAPIDAPILYPSNTWQTVSFLRGTNEVVGDSANASGSAVPPATTGYAANDTTSIEVFARRTLPNGTTIFSANAAVTADVTSNDVFAVNWTWDAVPNATGYRLLRNHNAAGFGEFRDVVGTTLTDTNGGWIAGSTVTPVTAQSGRSVKWNSGGGDPVGTTNSIPTQYGILESIAFVINTAETGPYDLYIDNVLNGTNIIQDFEAAVSGTTDFGFRTPGFSGTTSGNILTSPDVGQISNAAADTGTKSFHARFQWSGTNASKWLRLTTSGVGTSNGTGNPQVNLDQPISFRLLLLPPGSSPAVPQPPILAITKSGNDAILTWPGAHNLQAAPAVTGTYTNIPGVTTAPYTEPNAASGTQRFFRLVN